MGVKAPSAGVQGVALHGGVHGGQSAITGAKIYLYDAGSAPDVGGYGSASTSMLTSAVLTNSPLHSGQDSGNNYYVTTDASGGFNISGDWSCPSGTDQIYILALGGNPGLTNGTNNTGIALMTALGECDNILSHYTFININEVTTVASVWALQQFMASATQVGSSTANSIGLANAFLQIPNMVDINLGTALSTTSAPNSHGIVPHTEIYTLADILAYCINSDGTTITDTTTEPGTPLTNCGTLFYDATPTGGPPLTNTIEAALSIATNPANNVSGLLGLTSAQSPFSDKIPIASPPNDWTISIAYSGGGLITPSSIAVDQQGNIWVANPNVNTNIGPDAFDVSEFTTLGADLTGGNGYTNPSLSGPTAIAIDTSGNAWIADEAGFGLVLGYDISELDAGGNEIDGDGYFSPSLASPAGIAIDLTGNVWVSNASTNLNTGNYDLSEFNSNGVDISPGCPSACVGFSGGGLIDSEVVAADAGGDVWVANGAPNGGTYDISEFASYGDASGGGGYSGSWISEPVALAIDASTNVWYTNYFPGSNTSTVGLMSFNGADMTVTPSNPGGNGFPLPAGAQAYAIAIDGGGHAWVTDTNNNAIDEVGYDGSLNSPTGFQNSNISFPGGIAVDGSGNVWVTSAIYSPVLSGYLIEFVGAGAPVVTPLARGVANDTLGGRP